MTKTSVHRARSLGICVSTRGCADHVLGLTGAAIRAGISTEIFLTGDGVHLLGDHRFPELVSSARVSVCEHSVRVAGLDVDQVAGLTDKDFVTQWRHAEMVESCNRYLVL